MGLRWDDSVEHAAAGARAAPGRASVLAAALESGIQTGGLRLAVVALLFIGLLAVLFSNFAALSPSFGAQAPLLPSAAFSVIPDFTPVSAPRPDPQTAFRTGPAAMPSRVHLRSARLLDPRTDAAAAFRRLALADPQRICATLRFGTESKDWGPGHEGFAAFECFSSDTVEADVPMIPMEVVALDLPPEESEALEPLAMAEEEDAGPAPVAEPEMVAAPPKRSVFAIARGKSGEAVAFVRMKVVGETPKEAKVAASQAADAMERLYETLGWPIPADAARRIAALEPLKLEDSGTEIVFAKEGGAGENYNLSILFPDPGAFANARRTDVFEPRPSRTASR